MRDKVQLAMGMTSLLSFSATISSLIYFYLNSNKDDLVMLYLCGLAANTSTHIDCLLKQRQISNREPNYQQESFFARGHRPVWALNSLLNLSGFVLLIVQARGNQFSWLASAYFISSLYPMYKRIVREYFSDLTNRPFFNLGNS